jgi:hypothetical protein
VPADNRPPGGPTRRRARCAAADPTAPLSGPLERMWALVLRRFRDQVHAGGTAPDHPSAEEDDDRT